MGKVEGIFEINDTNFGNLQTHISLKAFKDAGCEYGNTIHVTIQEKEVVCFEKDVFFHQSFGFVEKGEPIIYNNVLMKVAMAVSQGSFCEDDKLNYGPEWQVVFTQN